MLADVPCSGDGTIRKNPEIWRVAGRGHASLLTDLDTWHSKPFRDIGHLLTYLFVHLEYRRTWSPDFGVQLHQTQLKILRRGVRLLAPWMLKSLSADIHPNVLKDTYDHSC